MRYWWSVIFLTCLQLGYATAQADVAYPIITVTCNQNDDLLKIKNEVKWGDAGKNFPFSAERGTYNPWNWVKIVEGNPGKGVIENTKLELSCQLSNNLYKIVLEPKIFNHSYNGKCGDRLSAKVTVFRGGAALVDQKALEEFCHGNAPIIRGIKIFGKSGRVKYYKIAKHKFF